MPGLLLVKVSHKSAQAHKKQDKKWSKVAILDSRPNPALYFPPQPPPPTCITSHTHRITHTYSPSSLPYVPPLQLKSHLHWRAMIHRRVLRLEAVCLGLITAVASLMTDFATGCHTHTHELTPIPKNSSPRSLQSFSAALWPHLLIVPVADDGQMTGYREVIVFWNLDPLSQKNKKGCRSHFVF